MRAAEDDFDGGPVHRPAPASAALDRGTDTGVAESRIAFLDARSLIGCRHRLRLDAEHPGTIAEVREDPGVQQRREAAAAHRLKVRDELVAAAPAEWVVIDPRLRAGEKAAATMAAMEAGAARIWGGLLPQEPDTGRRGGAEFLDRKSVV